MASPSLADGASGVTGTILLRGKPVPVRWSDGDTFTVMEGALKGKAARLVGYNTLESYGPVHRWGSWTGPELMRIAFEARDAAAAGKWTCKKQRKKDSYGRLLIDCPDARRALLGAGLAHVFAYKADPDPADLAAQREARLEKRGMWEKGRPENIVTNASADETGRVFLRVVFTRTGKTEVHHQRRDYSPCDAICEGPEVSGSCMLFIPYSQRYENQPACIQ